MWAEVGCAVGAERGLKCGVDAAERGSERENGTLWRTLDQLHQ